MSRCRAAWAGAVLAGIMRVHAIAVAVLLLWVMVVMMVVIVGVVQLGVGAMLNNHELSGPDGCPGMPGRAFPAAAAACSWAQQGMPGACLQS